MNTMKVQRTSYLNVVPEEKKAEEFLPDYKKNRTVPYWRQYIHLARPDHWVKNIFILPGIAFGLLMAPEKITTNIPLLLLGLLCACLASSSNYVVNEWLDRKFDQFHPKKKYRGAVLFSLNPKIVWAEYIFLLFFSLWISAQVSIYFFTCIALLLFMGVLYNVDPIRLKNRTYFDVLSEAINNPLRLLMGWFLVNTQTFPPASLLLAYWMGGCYLMSVKRYSEYCFIADKSIAASYRRSFQFYTSEKLLSSSLFYAVHCALFGGVFLIKYRPELLITFPFCALLFSAYLSLAFQADSAAQHPEKLYREKKLMIILGLFILTTAIGLKFDFQWLHLIQENTAIRLSLK